MDESTQLILPRLNTQVCKLKREVLLNKIFMDKQYKVFDDCPFCKEDGQVRVYVRMHDWKESTNTTGCYITNY